jgi:hypothetical protein
VLLLFEFITALSLIVGLESVKPATVVAVDPRDTLVEPIVTLELVNEALLIFDSVLLDPLIVLFVRVTL